jgi:hypothetical protein
MTARERTIYEATLDIDYAVCLADLHVRLFGRLRKIIAFIGMLGASAAVYSLISKSATAAGVYGLVVAILSAFDLVFDPCGAAAAHMRDKQALLSLRSRVAKLSLPRIDSELASIRKDASTTLRSLENLAHRNNLRSNGHPVDHLSLGCFEKIFDVIV